MKVVLSGLLLLFYLSRTAFANNPLRAPKEEMPGISRTNAARLWHSVVNIPRARKVPIRLRDRLNPVWWLFNCDEPIPPVTFEPHSKKRKFDWWIRNPFHDFVCYVIGVNDRITVTGGFYPEDVFNPKEGLNVAVTRYSVFFLPFISYRATRVETYIGWRPHGNFGIKFNIREPSRKRFPGSGCPAQ